jgi:hypothetical protein
MQKPIGMVPPGTNNADQSLSNLVGNMSLNQQQPYQYQQQPQWQMPTQQAPTSMYGQPQQQFGNPYNNSGPFQTPQQQQ